MTLVHAQPLTEKGPTMLPLHLSTLNASSEKKDDDFSSNLWTRSERRQWIAGLWCGCVGIYATRTVMPLCAVAVANEMGWNKSQSGAVLSAFFWGYTMTQVLGGYLSDRLGGPIVLTTAAIFWSLLTFWTPQLPLISSNPSTVLILMVLSRVIVGSSQGVHYPGTTSIVSKKVHDGERALTYSLIVTGSQCGTILCGSVGSYVLEHYGWHAPFHLVGLLGITWAFFVRYYLMAKEQRKADLAASRSKGSSPAARAQQDPVPWAILFKKSAFWALLIGHGCKNYCFFMMHSWVPTYFTETFPTAKGWVFNVVPWLISIPCALFGAWLADTLISKGCSVTFVRKCMQTVCMCGTATFLLIISHTKTFEWSLFCMTGVMCSLGFHNSGILINPTDLAPKYAGSVFGLMNTGGSIPGFLGVYMVGHILEVSKSWSVVFTLTAVICLLGWVVYMLFGSGKKQI